MAYKHTQVGYWTILATTALGGIVAIAARSPGLFGAMCIISVAAATLVGSLSTEIDNEAVAVHFGPIPLIRTRFPLQDIVTARAVRNSPVYGWGVRYIPHGRLWNVWGLDAVELQLTNGTRFRIGTDEPAALLDALHRSGVRV